MEKSYNFKAIIGKNSKVVQMLKNEGLEGFDFFSHKDIFKINFNVYEQIYIFSYSKNLDENFKFLKNLPLKKIVYISTVAVISLKLREQIFRYPITKKKIEEYIISNKGKVLRLGAITNKKYSTNENRNLNKQFNRISAVTELSHLKKIMCKENRFIKLRNFYKLYPQFKHESYFEKFLYFLHDKANIKFMRLLMIIIIRFIFKKNYSYSRDLEVYLIKRIKNMIKLSKKVYQNEFRI